MNTRLTVELDDRQLSSLTSLLVQSWTEEYAVRLLPVESMDEYAKRAVYVKFIQTYYSAYYSARAVLLTYNSSVINESSVASAMDVLADLGFYGFNVRRENSPYRQVVNYRPNLENRPDVGPDPLAVIYGLINQTAAIAVTHERHIIRAIGEDRYVNLLGNIPTYLLDSFVLDRFHSLTSSKQKPVCSASI